jgi:hypothetical protein
MGVVVVAAFTAVGHGPSVLNDVARSHADLTSGCLTWFSWNARAQDT